jgi:hypothetical protein
MVTDHLKQAAASPCVVSALWIIANVIKHAPEVHKDAPGGVGGDEPGAHLLGGGIGGHHNRAFLEANVVVLTKRLHQRGSLQHPQDLTLDRLFLL